MLQGSVLSSFLIALVYVTELYGEGVLSELLYTDDLALMSDTVVGLRNKFIKWKAFESKGLSVKFEKAKLMVSINMII